MLWSTPRLILLAATSSLFALLGAGLVVVSNVLYYRRTRDPRFWRRLWLHKSLLTPDEFVLNRAGFHFTFTIPIFLIVIVWLEHV